jgi:hypothetical protein
LRWLENGMGIGVKETTWASPAIDTQEDVAKALRFVWFGRGLWLEKSNLTQLEKGGTYNEAFQKYLRSLSVI